MQMCDMTTRPDRCLIAERSRAGMASQVFVSGLILVPILRESLAFDAESGTGAHCTATLTGAPEIHAAVI